MAAMITTDDNPFDPRVDWDQWQAWDVEHGYNTCAYLARIVATSGEFPEVLQAADTEKAIDEIIEIHAGGIYKKLPLGPAA